MPLINFKVELSLGWYENSILSSAGNNATFTITDAKLYVPIVTLSAENNAKLSKLLGKGFKRSIYWIKYKVIGNKGLLMMKKNTKKNCLIQAIKELKHGCSCL